MSSKPLTPKARENFVVKLFTEYEKYYVACENLWRVRDQFPQADLIDNLMDASVDLHQCFRELRAAVEITP